MGQSPAMPAAAAQALFLVVSLLVAGQVCGRLRLLGEGAAEVLNRVVLYVCLPAAILLHAPKITWSATALAVASVPWLLLAASVPLVALAARWLRLADDEKAVLLLCVPLGNTSFLGYPLVAGLLGPEALPSAVLYDQLGSFPLLALWGSWVLARFAPAEPGEVGGRRPPPTLGELAGRLVRSPPLVCLALALTVVPVELPAAVHALFTRLADAQLPLVALAVGLQLELRLPRGELAALAVGLLLKLGALPAGALLLVGWLGLSGTAAAATVLESAMPAMMTAAGLAIAARLAPRLAAALVAWGVLLALGTLPFWSWVSARG
jgi:predicted permease